MRQRCRSSLEKRLGIENWALLRQMLLLNWMKSMVWWWSSCCLFPNNTNVGVSRLPSCYNKFFPNETSEDKNSRTRNTWRFVSRILRIGGFTVNKDREVRYHQKVTVNKGMAARNLIWRKNVNTWHSSKLIIGLHPTNLCLWQINDDHRLMIIANLGRIYEHLGAFHRSSYWVEAPLVECIPANYYN